MEGRSHGVLEMRWYVIDCGLRRADTSDRDVVDMTHH
jgi:hypothetical protein